MVVVFGLFLSIALLVILVVFLRKNQLASARSALERDEALPPLKSAKKSLNALYEANPQNQEPQDSAKAEPVPVAVTTASPGSQENDWQEEVLTARKHLELDRALGLAKAACPRWGAFNQVCLTLRQMLREGNDDEQRERALKELYQAAAMAEFLHDREASQKLRQQQLLAAHSGMKGFQFDYQKLGYDKLRLIRKSDIKLFNRYWGVPPQHLLPRVLHQEEWQRVSD